MKQIKKQITWLKKNKFLITSIFFFILQIALLYKYIFLSRFENILWFCSHSSLFFGIGFLIKNTKLIKAFISVGLIIQILWVIDYLGKIIFGVFVFGAADYMFMDIPRFSYAVSAIEHFFTGTLALILTYKYKPQKKSLLYAFIYLLLLLTATLSFGSPEYNYNLTEHMIIFNEFTFPYYQVSWIFLAMIIIVIPTHYFQVLLYKIHIKKKKQNP